MDSRKERQAVRTLERLDPLHRALYGGTAEELYAELERRGLVYDAHMGVWVRAGREVRRG